MRRFYLIPFILLLAVSVMAQTPPQEDTKISGNDTRLEKKVTLAFNSSKLEDVLGEMQKQTGIEFTAGSSSRDWRVRERKVTVYANDTPIGVVMDELSKLLNYRVSRYGKTNEWGYLFWQDQKSKQLEAELVTAEKAATAQRTIALRQSAIESAQKALSLSPEDALKAKANDPWTAYLGGTKAGRGFASIISALGQVAPTERDLMLRGARVDISLDKLPPELMNSVNDSVNGGLGGIIRKSGNGILSSITPSGITFMPMGDISNMDTAGLVGFGGMAIITGKIPGMPDISGISPFGNGIPLGVFPITSGNSLVGNAFANLYFALDQGKSIEEAIVDLQSQVANPDYLAASMARESITEKNPPSDPELTREIEIADMQSEIKLAQMDPVKSREIQGKIIQELSRAFGMPVMMESFNGTMPLGLFIKPGRQPLYMALVGIEKAGYHWEKGQGVIRIRPEDWALRRSYEIPEEFLLKCKETLAKQGRFTLDDFAYIAYSLTDDQIQNNLVAEPELTYALAGLLVPIGGDRHILRAYGSMNQRQRAALKDEKGLSFADLSNEQWDLVYAAISERIGGGYIVDGTIRLMEEPAAEIEGEENNEGVMKMPTFETTVLLENENNPRVIRHTIVIPTKDQITEIKEAQKAAQDEAAKADKSGINPIPQQMPRRNSTVPSVR